MVVDFVVDIFVSVGYSLPHLNTRNINRTKFLKNLFKKKYYNFAENAKNRTVNEYKVMLFVSFLS